MLYRLFFIQILAKYSFQESGVRITNTSATVLLPFLSSAIGNHIDFTNICIVYFNLQICITTVR
jgi:hypothetical protein